MDVPSQLVLIPGTVPQEPSLEPSSEVLVDFCRCVHPHCQDPASSLAERTRLSYVLLPLRSAGVGSGVTDQTVGILALPEAEERQSVPTLNYDRTQSGLPKRGFERAKVCKIAAL